MATTERLTDFPAKTTPTPSDIVYVGNAADSDNEVKSTIAQIIAAYPGLASIGGLTTVADRMIYTTGANVYATATLTAFARTLLDDADAATMRTTLGLGTASVIDVPVTAPNGGSGVASPTIHGILVAQGASAFATKVLTNGQLLIGSTGLDPVAATLSAGSGISISNTAGGITISGTGSGIGWTEVTGTTQAMAADSAYVSSNAGLVTLTLPATAAFGTAIVVLGKGAGGWLIAQNGGQNIQVGSSSTTVGAGGSVASTNRYDSITMICTTANTTWSMYGAPQGNLTIV